MLRRSHLIMLRLGGYPDSPKLFIYVLHKPGNPLAYRSEVVVVKLLPFRRHCSEKRAPCIYKILSLKEFLRVHKEVFLLYPYRRSDLFGRSISKEANQPERLLINRLHGTQKGCLLVERFASVGTKCRRDAECRPCSVMPYKCRRCAIPRRIAPGLKCRPKPSRRERRRVRLSLDQLLA